MSDYRRPAFFSFLTALSLFFIALSFNACAQKEQVQSQNGTLQIDKMADGLDHPWAIAFLPDGRLLITERSGDLHIMNSDSSLTPPLGGVPAVYARSQGGLLDVAIDPDFENNKLIYLSFAEEGTDGLASTALGRGTLEGNQINNFEVIFSQTPKVDGGNHFGSRIVFHDGYLFLTMGERYKFEPAQDLNSHLGKVIRIYPDGSIPEDNPFAGDANALPEIWTYGNRNIQSAAIDPATGNLWVAEFGPKGGDELNLIKKAKNYGWPEVSWGSHYNGVKIPDPDGRPEFTESVLHWTPVISPSGMAFYEGEMFNNWQGKMLIGGLSSQALVVVETKGETAKEAERLDMGARIRDVAIATDGSVYLITDQSNGKVLRLSK